MILTTRQAREQNCCNPPTGDDWACTGCKCMAWRFTRPVKWADTVAGIRARMEAPGYCGLGGPVVYSAQLSPRRDSLSSIDEQIADKRI